MNNANETTYIIVLGCIMARFIIVINDKYKNDENALIWKLIEKIELDKEKRVEEKPGRGGG